MEQLDSTYSEFDESQNSTNDDSMHLANNMTNNESLKLVKTDIENLIAQNSSRITFMEKNPKMKSEIWKLFSRVVVDGKLQDFVVCNTCRIPYAWKARTGTMSLYRHTCHSPTTKIKRGAAKAAPVKTSESIQNYLVKSVPHHAKRAFNKSITFGLAKDLRSLNSVEGMGFKHLAQALINFGAKYGYQRVEDVIQHRTTLRNTYVPELCNETREQYKLMFQSLPSNHKFAFSKDLWSEKYQKRTFLSLSIHFIDDTWKLHAVMLGLDEMLEAKTTEYIRERCSEILKSYFDESRVENVINTSFAVTDGGKNVLTVFRNQSPCECHKLNLFVDWILNEKKLPKQEKILERLRKGNPYNPKKLFNLQTNCPSIYKSLTGVKNTVTYFKQSHLNAMLPSTLKQAVETRWDSCLQLLEAYVKVKDEAETLLLKHRQLEKVKDVDHDLLNELIKFLTPIRKCSKTLSGDKYPTIQLVAMCYFELKEEIENFKPSSQEIKSLLEQAKVCFKEYVVIRDIHYAACMLDPRYRQIKFAERSKRNDAVNYLKNLVEEQGEKRIRHQCVSTLASSQKTDKTKSARFKKFQDDEDYKIEEDEISEVDRYLNQKFDLKKYEDEAAILLLFCNLKLGYDKDTSTAIYHTYEFLLYIFAIVGAIIGDSWLGMYKTLLWTTIFCAVGFIWIAVSVTDALRLPMAVSSLVCLVIATAAAGCSKPLGSAYGAQQYRPDEVKSIALFFALHYFMLNCGSIISRVVSPILREDVKCFGNDDCFPLVFGIPGVLMILVALTIVIANKYSTTSQATGTTLLDVLACIWNAITTRFKSRKSKKDRKKRHWLDYSEEKCGKTLVLETKAIINIVVLYLPIPLFWALYFQQGSRWVLQAIRMNGDLGFYTIKPDQLSVINPLLVLILIPVFEYILYPLLEKVGIGTPLQKVTLGGTLAGLAFTISAIVETQIDGRYLHIAFLIPQFLTMAMGEILIIVPLMNFSYIEAPKSMKSTLQAFRLLCIGLGNLIVVIIAGTRLFESQLQELILFAGLMFINMIIFGYLATKYESIKLDEGTEKGMECDEKLLSQSEIGV